MIDKGIVYGGEIMAVPVYIGKDTVYVHTDITPITEWPDGEPAEGQYTYNEIQYSKDEYLKLMDDSIQTAKDDAAAADQRAQAAEEQVNAIAAAIERGLTT